MKTSPKKSGLYDTIDQLVTDGLRRGLAHLTARDERLNGRTVRIRDADVLNFGSASYMHLEQHPALVEGARDALERYGTQFSASRAYLQIGMYDELEDNLGKIFGKPALAAGSTTLGHLSAIPVLIDDKDAVILDQQVHSSIQTVVQILKARNVPIHLIRHNRMDQLEDRVNRLRGSHRTIWYFADGIYSMFGDGAPVHELYELMDRYPQLRVYMDDAHGFGWTGPHGAGWVRARIPHHDQMILAVSLNKAYASAGGALIFPNQEEKQRVRNCGPTLIFCGPIQPPMLGAAIAATRLHLSDEIIGLQKQLADRVDYCVKGLERRGLPLVEPNDTPLYFVPTGLPRLVYEIVLRMLEDGCFLNVGAFPAVPMSTGGVRFHMHRGLAFEDIDYMLDRLELHWKTVLTEESITPMHLVRAFRLRHLESVDLTPPEGASASASPPEVALEVHQTDDIAEVPVDLWDACYAGKGPLSHSALTTLATAFGGTSERGQAASRFVWITDADGKVVLAAPLSISLAKEDMFASAEISEKVEAMRETEGADFLVSKAVALGMPITLGPHLYLDRSSLGWKDALKQFVDVCIAIKESEGATRILLREFETGADPELKQELLDLGFIEAGMPPMMTVEGIEWDDRDGYVASLKSRYRNEVRKEILPHLDTIRVDTSPLDDAAIDACFELYQRVHARGRQLNVIALPRDVFDAMCRADEFDVLRFFIGDELGAVMLSHYRDGRYSALLVGFDEEFLHSHAIYKASLFLTVERARELGATSVNLAFTAEVVKRKVGARPTETCAYALIDDTFGAGVMMNL